jgi:hypothetical protein
LTGKTTWGPRTGEIHRQHGGCIALSRDLAKQLGLYRGPGVYDYDFGAIIELEGCGQFTFADLMPPKWRQRVDIYYPTLRQCRVFGVKKLQIRVVEKGR